MALKHADRFWKIFAAVLAVLISTKLSRAASTVDPVSTVGNTCSEWTEWIDDEDGGTLDPSSIGEFELIDQLRGPYGFCDEPTDIECALADDTNTPYDGTGQVSLTCNLQQGFLCFHSQQSGDCFNYAIRVQCPAPCPSLTTKGNRVTEMSSTSSLFSTEFSDAPSTGEFTTTSKVQTTTELASTVLKTSPNSDKSPMPLSTEFSTLSKTDKAVATSDAQTTTEITSADMKTSPISDKSHVPFSTESSTTSNTVETRLTSSVITTTELASTDLKTSANSDKSALPSSAEFSTASNTDQAVTTSDAQTTREVKSTVLKTTAAGKTSTVSTYNAGSTGIPTTPSQRAPTTANNKVTDIRTDPPTECPPADSGDCSEENLLCKTEYEVKASMNSEANFGPCVPQHVSEAFANEQRENLRDGMPLCCLQCVFNRGENSRRRRDTSGDIVTVVSRILVYDNSTVTAEAVLEAFVSSVRQSSVLGSYGLSYINGTASVVKQDLEPATPKPENDSFKMVVVICSTIAGLVVVITVALCFVCIIQRSFPTGKRGRKPAIYRNPLSKTQEGTLLMKEWSFGSATPKGKRQWTDKISAGVDTGSKDELNVSSRERSDQMVSKRWSYLYGRGPNEQPRASEVQKGAHSLPRPGGYNQEKGQRGTDNYQEHVHSNGQRVTGRPGYAAFPKVIIRPPAQQRNLYYNIDSIGYSGYTL